MKKFFQTSVHSSCTSTGLLFVRLVMGAAMILHGWGKIQSPFSWMPDSPVPGFFQFLAAFSEFGGGIALILGLLTRLASLGIGFTMLVAFYFHAVILGDPFVSKGGGSYELSLVFLSISVLLIMSGPGKYSLDKVIFGEK